MEELFFFLAMLGVLFLAEFVMKTIDLVMKKLVEKTLFSNLFNTIHRKIKIVKTKLTPITIKLNYNVQIDDITSTSSVIEKGPDIIRNAFEILEEPHYNKDRTIVQQKVKIGSLDYTVKIIPVQSVRNEKLVVEDLKIQIISKISFSRLYDSLINLSSYIPDFNKHVNKTFGQMIVSSGIFECKVNHGELDALEWLKKKKFSVNMLIRAEEEINISIYSDRATVQAPDLKITDKVALYLREIILNYYL